MNFCKVRALNTFAMLAMSGVLFLLIAAPTMPAVDDPDKPNGFKEEAYATGLDSPWGMAFLPDGRLLVTEKIGNLRIVDTDGAVSDPLGGVPEVCLCGQGGLLDVQLHPDYDENGWIYIAYAEKRLDADDKPIGWTAIMRARLDGMNLINQESIYQAPVETFSGRPHHFGSRIVFDNDGYLYFSIGDRGMMNDAQVLSRSNGKMHRLHDDGRIPEDNPFFNMLHAESSIWSFGHRNPQGLAVHPEDGSIWTVEHGPKGGDELNRVEKGLNYGWPVITYGINYNDEIISDITEKEGMEQPAHYWVPSIATCGMEFYDGDAFPDWKNSIFVASLKFGQIHRVEVDGSSRTHEEVFYKTGGRPRDVAVGPDGYLYIAIEDAPGRIVRLVPDNG
ncbi:MAG: PQQ-dependent sugar dehydrogenase [Bacteroidota bacterium]